jgi:GWxTD domain-containing protein
VLAATGGNLVKRVRRLLVQPEGPRATPTPVFSAIILTVTATAALTAWQTSAPPRPPAPAVPPAPSVPAPVRVIAQARPVPAPAPGVTPYTKWVIEDVAYIITNDERAAFKNLQSDPEREHFIEQFWLRRDPTPGTPENEMKEEHYRRIAYANDHFAAAVPGWKTDRGRIYIMYGPPDEKETHPSGDTAKPYPYEQWLYHLIQGVGTNVVIEFVDPDRTGEYRMTMDPSAKDALIIVPREKAGATVQPMIPGGVLISVPLTAYGDHKVTVYGRVDGDQGLQVFEQIIQGPAPLYTKIIKVPIGSHRLEISVKDTATGKVAADTIDFEVK